MTTMATLTLNDGRSMPQLGFGTYQIADAAAEDAVRTAIDVGYRLVDTAAIYANERGVGKGLDGAENIFLTTKVWNDSQGYAAAKAAFALSLERLRCDAVDLLLIHWPCADRNLYVDTWKAFIELHDEGKARSIGVSNFLPAHLDRLVNETGVVPTVNQIELHPRFQQRELRQIHRDLGIITQSWSPLGQGNGLVLPAIATVAKETGQSPAAVIIRWHLQHGFSVIPKASSRAHMVANFSAGTFVLTPEQMARIDALDVKSGRIGPDPHTFA